MVLPCQFCKFVPCCRPWGPFPVAVWFWATVPASMRPAHRKNASAVPKRQALAVLCIHLSIFNNQQVRSKLYFLRKLYTIKSKMYCIGIGRCAEKEKRRNGSHTTTGSSCTTQYWYNTANKGENAGCKLKCLRICPCGQRQW